jgi:RNA polymerase sigma factor (sigma-70 family)
VTPEAAYAAHQAYLLHMASRLTGSVTTAEDLVQTMWLRACRSWDQFEGRDNCTLRSWLGAILKNAHIMQIRRDRARIESFTRVPMDHPLLRHEPRIDEAIDRQKRIDQALRRLPADKAARVLAWARGEVSFASDATSTPKVQLFRAIQQARGRKRHGAKGAHA